MNRSTETMQHTPGEWKSGASDAAAIVYALNRGGSNRFYANVQSGWVTDTRSESDERTGLAELIADARLMAAAPELLEALESLTDASQWAGITDPHERETVGNALKKARVAIDKARGQ